MANKETPIPKRKPMDNKEIPIPKRKPMYSSKVYRDFETRYPQVDWDDMTTSEKDAWISMSMERSSPPLELPTGGQEIAKGGLIKKKKKKLRHGGVHTKRPQMMGGGAYKGKKHTYAAGGKVAEMKLGK